MIPEWADPDEIDPHESLKEELDKMQVDFTGQRADKFTVDLTRRGGIEIDYYTITCDECGGTGYYNDIGEVICDSCGLVLAGGDNEKPLTFKDYSGSRGFSDQEDDIYHRAQMGPTGVA